MHLSCIHMQARRPLPHSGNPTRTATLKWDTGGMARGERPHLSGVLHLAGRPLLCKFRPPTSIRLPSQVRSLSKSKSARFGLFMLLLLCCIVVKLNHTIQTVSEQKKGGAMQYDVMAGSWSALKITKMLIMFCYWLLSILLCGIRDHIAAN
jgi:hypothetical protein